MLLLPPALSTVKIIELPALQAEYQLDHLIGRWNVTCGYSPIDFNWHFLAPFSTLWTPQWPEDNDSSAFRSDARSIRTFFNKTFLPLIMACHGEGLDDLRGKDQTGLVAVPGDNTIDLVGIVYKVDNNGDTLFCYKEGYPSVTDSIISNMSGYEPKVLGSLHVKKSSSS